MSRNGDSYRMRLLSFGYISLQKYEIAAIFVEFSASDLATIMFYVCFANLNRQFFIFYFVCNVSKEEVFRNRSDGVK